MAFDAATGTVLLFGGLDAGQQMRDTWSWNGTTWKQLHPLASPSARSYMGISYDVVRKRVVLFGGLGAGGGVLGDTWEWNGSTWIRVATTGPAARESFGMAYDVLHRQTVVFGGCCDQFGEYFSDTWTWDGSAWTRAALLGPFARSDLGMAYDLLHRTVVMYGGYFGGEFPTVFANTWTWDGSKWTQRAPYSRPGARLDMSMAYDVLNDRVVMFGGTDGFGVARGDTWGWTGSAWQELDPGAS
jgi:hypothetical protein